MNPESSIFVAGHRGLVGSAIVRRLRMGGFQNLVLRERRELDLTRQAAVESFFAEVRPQYVFFAAAKVGGILANERYPAEFLQDNLVIQTNIIDAAWRSGARKLLFLGSSCIYPKHAPQPIPEEALLTLRKIHEAKLRQATEVEVWGTGQPRREFLHVDDLADACVFLMQKYDDDGWINVGWGSDATIAELARTICRVVGFEGTLRFDSSKPDGTPRKLLDTTRLRAVGWSPRIELEAGIRSTYEWFLNHYDSLKV
jgi:GDP-L-fucose synthase